MLGYKPLFQLLFLLICLLTCLDSRRRAGAGRAFEDRKADERHFDYKSAPGEAIPEDSEESEKPKIVLGSGGGSTVEPSSTTTEVPTTTEEETTTTQSNEDLVKKLLEGVFDLENLTKIVEEEHAEALDEATNRTVLWIDTSYKAMDYNLSIDEMTECATWQKYWNLSETIKETKTSNMSNSGNETEEIDDSEKELKELEGQLKQTELVNSKSRLKTLGLNPELLVAYKAVGLVYREVCGNHGRTLWYRTREDANLIGVDSFSPICEPFKEQLNPDESTLSQLALKLNELIQNVTDGNLPALRRGGHGNGTEEEEIQNSTMETILKAVTVEDTVGVELLPSSTPTESVADPSRQTTTTQPHHHHHHHHHGHHQNHQNPNLHVQQVHTIHHTEDSNRIQSSESTTTPPHTQDYEIQDQEFENQEFSSGLPPEESTTQSPTTTTEKSSEIEVYDDDVWDYRDMEKRFKVRHRTVFDENNVDDDESFHMASARKRRRHVILKTKVRIDRRRRKRETSEEEEEGGEKETKIQQESDENEDDWLNVRQVIKTTDGETTVAIIEERSHILDGNSTDVRAWIEIDASDLINPTLLISSPEAVAALGLEVDSTAFQRFENVGLYLPGICSEYVPKAIDEFNSSSFEGIEIEGPIGVNITALELAGVNLTSLADKLRNDTEVDEILSRTNGSAKNLGGSFILPVLNKNQYDPFSAPIVFQGSAVVVRFGIYIESMSNFQTSTMDYDMDIYLMMSWRDARLVNPYDKPILVKEEDILEKIWRPDPFFANAKEAEFHEVTFLNFLMRIFPDGLVLYETRVKIKPSCNLILCKYPHDKQTCDLLIKSFAYPVETVRFEWFTRRKDAIDKNPDVKLPELYIDRYETTTCANERKSGAFSCLRAVFRLKRDVGFHIAQTYIPTSLALMFSWVGVWLPEEFMEGRIGVAITVLLTLSTESAGAREHLPSVSYLKAIDLWFGFITGFVFFTLLQTLFVIGFDKRANQLKKWAGRKTADITEEIREVLLQKATRYHKTGRYLDNFCRVFYPLSFILFLLMYYFVFTEGRQDDCMNRR
ncbi:hypothetical protein L5515_015398 [Caenorhabditis briggsae]|uniref:Uncharacterized protein n=2 Tax=Caenorhabditis briggsae TaxID=6238 RepID=A0AAE9J991_CAEBR|nr:hypothetical protein L5515_015398 [Caenorhabditis briggsae]